MKFQLSKHARRAVAEREIPIELIERTLQAPELILSDPNDATIARCFRRIVSRSLPFVSTAKHSAQVVIPALRPCLARRSLGEGGSLTPVAPFLNLAGECFEWQ